MADQPQSAPPSSFMAWARKPLLAGVMARIAALQTTDPLAARAWRYILGFGAFCVVERLLFVFVVVPPRDYVESDMAGYINRAWRLASPNVTLNRFDTFFPPGMHLLMTPAFLLLRNRDRGIWANQFLMYLFGVAALVMVCLLAWRLFRHPVPVLFCLVVLEGYVPFAQYAGFFLSEIPFVVFMTSALLLGLMAHDEALPHRRAWLFAAAGLLGGVATVIRPQFALTAVFIGFPLLSRRWPFVRVKDAAILATLFVLPVLGGVMLNRHAAHTPVGLAGNGGFNFYQGHCDVDTVETVSSEGGLIFTSPARLQRLQREGREERRTSIQGHMAWENDYFFALGMDCIRHDGAAHLERIASNVADFLWASTPWPASTGPTAPVASVLNAVYLLCVAVALPFAIRLRRRPERWLLLQLCTMLPIPILFYGDSRFRIPYDIFGVLLVAGVLAHRLGLRRDEGT